jgi:glycerol-3-phosphate acyltransferase PlsY
VAAIVGHMFSPWARFKGGRGVATSLGVFLAIVTLPTAIVLGLWILLFALSRRVSVGSIGAALAYPFLVLWLTPRGAYHLPIVAIGSVVAILILLRHIPNMKRLAKGEERPLIGRGSKEEGA